MVDYADKGGLARSVGAEESVDFPLGDCERYVVERRMTGKALGDVLYFKDSVHKRSWLIDFVVVYIWRRRRFFLSYLTQK